MDAQRELSQTDCGGTPLEWATLMRVIATTNELPAAALSVLRSTLGWSLTEFPENRDTFSLYETKGGSLPGVLTEASYIRPLGTDHGSAIALFFRDLPADIDSSSPPHSCSRGSRGGSPPMRPSGSGCARRWAEPAICGFGHSCGGQAGPSKVGPSFGRHPRRTAR